MTVVVKKFSSISFLTRGSSTMKAWEACTGRVGLKSSKEIIACFCSLLKTASTEKLFSWMTKGIKAIKELLVYMRNKEETNSQ